MRGSGERFGPVGPYRLALLLAVAYLACALPRLPDYGPTWDFVMGDYPYGERLVEYVRTGEPAFLDLSATEPQPPVREPHLDLDVGRFSWFQIFPVASFLSGASCRLLWTELGIVPAMPAHHLPAPLLAALLIFFVTAWATRRWGLLAGIVAGGSLALNPNFFGHSCHNLKDVAECCFYTGAVLAGFNALDPTRSSLSRQRWWLAAGAMTALALAEKPNALFLPIQMSLFIVVAWLLLRSKPQSRPRLEWRGVLWASGSFLLVYYAVSPAYWSAPIEGPRQVISQMLRGGSAPADLERTRRTALEVLKVVLFSTPPVTLVLAGLGAFRRGIKPLERWFLLLGVGLPIARNFLPGMRHYGGTRHFMEFMPMLALLAGNGALLISQELRRRLPEKLRFPALTPAAVTAMALLPCGIQVVATHPNQTVYLNSLVGGYGGARARGMRDVGDHWGNSYWQGLRWLSENASADSTLLVPVAGHVARAAAPLRLRPDIRILANDEWGEPPFYAMYITLTQRGFVGALDREHEPIHEIRVQGAAILRIHRLDDDASTVRLRKIWVLQKRGRAARRRILSHLRASPNLARAVEILTTSSSTEEAVKLLLPYLPPELHPDIEPAVELYRWNQGPMDARGL